MSIEAVGYTMQALVKYHGLKDWKLRLPYHDSISVNTTCMMTRAKFVEGKKGGVYISGKKSESANARLQTVLRSIGAEKDVSDLRIESRNLPAGNAKGIGYSSSAGAALTLLCHRLIVGGNPDMRELSRKARLFAASAARSLVGGFSRLYAADDEGTYAERFADSRTMDLRMVIVPLSSGVHTEDAHREVLSSPFFEARIGSAQKRCDEVERAIRGNDLKRLGELVEKDTLELHAVTMTGGKGMLIMSEDSIRIIRRVRQLREDGVEAYFSMQTGPSVFINTSEKYQERVYASIRKMGYRAFRSGVGPEARLLG